MQFLLSGVYSMSDAKSSSSSDGIGVLGLLGVVFVTLKLCGVIDWSWWWVTLPFWGGFALLLLIGLVLGVVWIGIAAHEWAKASK